MKRLICILLIFILGTFGTSVYSEEFAQLMCELSGICEEFTYLGSYSEVV